MTDPYATLGVSRSSTDKEIRSAYRTMVQRHHPDHNGGSADSARRFEEIQLAYAAIREDRAGGAPHTSASAPPPRPASGPASDVDARMAQMEFELREAQRKREEELRQARAAQERAAQAAREAARAAHADAGPQDAREHPRGDGRASDEELGYYTTDDSLGAILSDAREELSGRFSHAREHPTVQRVSGLIDQLDDFLGRADRSPRSEQ